MTNKAYIILTEHTAKGGYETGVSIPAPPWEHDKLMRMGPRDESKPDAHISLVKPVPRPLYKMRMSELKQIIQEELGE